MKIIEIIFYYKTIKNIIKQNKQLFGCINVQELFLDCKNIDIVKNNIVGIFKYAIDGAFLFFISVTKQ